MRNWAKFDIQGNIAKIDATSPAVRVDIAANYSRKKKDSDEWENDPHFNRVTFFGKDGERVAKFGVGDLIHVDGRVRQGSYEKAGERIYTVDLIADAFARVTKKELNAEGAD
jgi:single-strand DNA-binding protein